MAEFKQLIGRMVPLLVNDIDTDQIIPARFLKATDKSGMGDNLFADWRYNEDGNLNQEFPLNDPEYAGAKILIAGDNFGCGSSREHAPWALIGYGFKAIVSTSFADIFKNNALKNGLLPIEVEQSVHSRIAEMVKKEPKTKATVDLKDATLRVGEVNVNFPVDPFAKDCLLRGVDELGYILSFESEIEAYERRRYA